MNRWTGFPKIILCRINFDFLPTSQILTLPTVCTYTHHSFLALGIGILFLSFMVFVDFAAGIWVLSEEERKLLMLFNTGVCVCLCACSASKAVLMISGVFSWKRMGTKPCLLQHYRHHLLPCLAVPPVIRFYVRAQSPFSVSDNASANFG